MNGRGRESKREGDRKTGGRKNGLGGGKKDEETRRIKKKETRRES